MALPPKFAGHRLTFAPPGAPATSISRGPLHTVELYLDFVCPFSCKMFKTVWGSVVSQLRSEPVVGPNMQLIFRHQVQPWHPSSTLTHEAALAVQQLAPDSFWDFAAALFAVQGDFFDVNVVGEPRNKTYSRLARLAAQSVDVAEDEVYALLAVPDKPAPDGSLDVGNQVTKNLTIVVKMARLVGVHVSPTVITNGIIANEITSLWTTEQWMEYLKKLVS